jgi:hypothetical protein
MLIGLLPSSISVSVAAGSRGRQSGRALSMRGYKSVNKSDLALREQLIIAQNNQTTTGTNITGTNRTGDSPVIVNVNQVSVTPVSNVTDIPKCGRPRPSFCTNVDWLVPDSAVEASLKAKSDLQVELMFVNFIGTKECKRQYRDLHCRYIYPKCNTGGVGAHYPCRQECEDFAKVELQPLSSSVPRAYFC